MRRVRRAKQERVFLFASTHFNSFLAFELLLQHLQYQVLPHERGISFGSDYSAIAAFLAGLPLGFEMEAENSFLLHLQFDKI